ncbi:MAG: translocation/assembly module TamB domain-containing protein [Deltaproteobacteria bacterium]|nr:translocation/assembly module TamB domain-containing protein [Deltaproteobacteria bacterium]
MHARTTSRFRAGLRRRLVVWLLLTSAVAAPWIAVAALNHPAAQRLLLRAITAFTKWEIQSNGWHWDLRHSTVTIDRLQLTHHPNGHHFSTERITFAYRPWSLLRGTLRLTELTVSQPRLFLEQMPPATTARRPIKLRTLLLLRNVEITHAAIHDLLLTLPHGRSIGVARTEFSFIPHLLRKVALTVQLQQIDVNQPDRPPLHADQLTLDGVTDPSHWFRAAPYLNDLHGALHVTQFSWKHLVVDSFAADATLRNTKVRLKSLQATIGGRTLRGDGSITLATKRSRLTLEWPEPMPIPDLLPATSFLQTAGTLQGRIQWKGKSFDPTNLQGELKVDVTHVPATITDLPAHLTVDSAWHDGTMQIRAGRLRVGDGEASVSGSVSARNRLVDIEFHGRAIPLIGVFGRFRNIDFHPARGLANCDGRFRGWARDYLLTLDAETTGGGSYQGIEIETARTKLHLTYPRLELTGELLQHGARTGTLALDIRYGNRLPSGYRQATMRLDADIRQHHLDPSFQLIALRGVGSGHLTLGGETSNPHGNGTFEITAGALQIVPLDRVHAKFRWNGKTLTFQPTTVEVPTLPTFDFPQPMTVTLGHGFHLRGHPRADTTLDLEYQSPTAHWIVHEIRIHGGPAPHDTTTIRGHGRSGAWDLRAVGTANAAWLTYLPGTFREAEGPLDLNLGIRGDLTDPLLSGTMELRSNQMILRAVQQEWTKLLGTLHFNGRRITIDTVSGLFGDGPFTLDGWLEQQQWTTRRFDLHVVGRGLAYAEPGRAWHAEFDTDMAVRRDNAHTTLSGDLNIVDLRYTKDFRLLEEFGRSDVVASRERLRREHAGYDHVKLDLRVNSRGDLFIRNNAADVTLRANVVVRGTLANPQVQGNIEATEGRIHYLGLEFTVVNGTVEFHTPFAEPFVEFRGEESIGTHLVQVTLRGPINNLYVDLAAIPGEDRKNVLCLIAYGTTCDQLRTIAFGAKVGPTIFAEQLGKILARPLARYTKLDVVRLESAVGTTDLTRLHIGKRISDRLEVGFVTSVGQTAAEQSLEASYQITDFLLLKGTQSTKGHVGGKLSFRFRER